MAIKSVEDLEKELPEGVTLMDVVKGIENNVWKMLREWTERCGY